jgi:hypothetical protein
MINLDQTAPSWAHRFKQAIEIALEQLWTRPLPVYTVATLPTPTDKKWLWRQIAVSDGAGNKFVAVCNGTAWYYLQGTAV